MKKKDSLIDEKTFNKVNEVYKEEISKLPTFGPEVIATINATITKMQDEYKSYMDKELAIISSTSETEDEE